MQQRKDIDKREWPGSFVGDSKVSINLWFRKGDNAFSSHITLVLVDLLELGCVLQWGLVVDNKECSFIRIMWKSNLNLVNSC